MSKFAPEILRRIEEAFARFVANGIPGASVTGQVPGAVLPPPAADADVPYAATNHTHPLADLEQGGATDGQVVTWDDGTSMWIPSDPAGGVADGDKGDVTVSGSGTVWTIDNDAVTYAKMQNMSPNRLLGRSTAGAGDVEEIQIGTGLVLSAGVLNTLFFNPMSAEGDLITAAPGAIPTRLAIGTANQLLTTDGTNPSWGPIVSPYTPTYTGATTAGSTTYSVQVGHYMRLGPLCWFSARVDWTAATGTGVAQVSLPLTAKNIANYTQVVSAYIINVTFAASGIMAGISPGASVALLNSPTSNAGSSLVGVEPAGTIILTGFYEVN